MVFSVKPERGKKKGLKNKRTCFKKKVKFIVYEPHIRNGISFYIVKFRSWKVPSRTGDEGINIFQVGW